MFEQLFTSRGVLARHERVPLAHERRLYLADRATAGLAPATLRNLAQRLLIVAQALDLPPHGFVDGNMISAAADHWAQRMPPSQASQKWQEPRQRFVRVATGWFRFLGRFQEPETQEMPFGSEIEAFIQYMRHERGLAHKTINMYTRYPRQFCQWFSAQQRSFTAVTVGDVDTFLALHHQCWCRVSVSIAAKALRAFFRYAEHQQWCAAGLAAAIESPRLFRQETLPAGPSWAQVQQLLAQSDRDLPRDIRDRAILMLLALYGFRSGEVATLQLDQLDWRHEQITIGRTKQHQRQTYPLTQDMGMALIRYLQKVRPPGPRREVFLTLLAPWRPLSAGALDHVTRTRLTRIGYVGQHYGPHTLRHACATHLMSCNLSLKEIGDHLGHRSPDATRTYAKVDIQGLRDVARFDMGEIE